MTRTANLGCLYCLPRKQLRYRCDHIILDIQTSSVWAVAVEMSSRKVRSNRWFHSGYVNTASNLEILAQLVPFLISWPNEGVQQMMLGRVECVCMLSFCS